MRILFVGDVHWSETSSIVRTIGTNYSSRLENLIKSVNWAEGLAREKNCGRAIYLGDFFDRPDINSAEVTALFDDVIWYEIPHDFVVGNHESKNKDLNYSTTKVLQINPQFKVVDKPQIAHIADFCLCYIPYVTEDNRHPFVDYVEGNKKIVISHNDIKGIRYGAYESKDGFDLDEIEKNCDLFINGHLHNGNFLNKNETILNLGNLTGQNFTEDAKNYQHLVCILDTDSMKLEFYENPYAFNFYKVDINSENELIKLDNLKSNAVVTVKCLENLKPLVEEKVKNFAASRIIIVREVGESKSEDGLISINNINHCEEFIKCATSVLGKSEILDYELSKVLGA